LERVGDILKSILDPRTTETGEIWHRFFCSWDELVGPNLAGLTRLVEVERGEAIVEVRNFDTDIATCIARDLKRPNSVGEKVIKNMFSQFLRPKAEIVEQDEKLPPAIICDLDGTLALLNGRNPYDASKCEEDLLNKPVAEVIKKFLKSGIKVLFVSGRSFDYYYQTKYWLNKNKMPIDPLWMRKIGDNRKDAIIKREIYDEHIAGRFHILFVLDDREQMVEMWRLIGLTCFQVASGEF